MKGIARDGMSYNDKLGKIGKVVPITPPNYRQSKIIPIPTKPNREKIEELRDMMDIVSLGQPAINSVTEIGDRLDIDDDLDMPDIDIDSNLIPEF